MNLSITPIPESSRVRDKTREVCVLGEIGDVDETVPVKSSRGKMFTHFIPCPFNSLNRFLYFDRSPLTQKVGTLVHKRFKIFRM